MRWCPASRWGRHRPADVEPRVGADQPGQRLLRGRPYGGGIVEVEADDEPVAQHEQQVGRPLRVELPDHIGPEEGRALDEAIHQVCPYSNATRGNMPVELVIE